MPRLTFGPKLHPQIVSSEKALWQSGVPVNLADKLQIIFKAIWQIILQNEFSQSDNKQVATTSLEGPGIMWQ